MQLIEDLAELPAEPMEIEVGSDVLEMQPSTLDTQQRSLSAGSKAPQPPVATAGTRDGFIPNGDNRKDKESNLSHACDICKKQFRTASSLNRHSTSCKAKQEAESGNSHKRRCKMRTGAFPCKEVAGPSGYCEMHKNGGYYPHTEIIFFSRRPRAKADHRRGKVKQASQELQNQVLTLAARKKAGWHQQR